MRILLEPIKFVWDKGNTDKNRFKHKVSNEECEDIFTVNRFILLKDKTHSMLEDRHVVIGPNVLDKILTLIITIRGKSVRIISARPASKKERQLYEKTFKAT